MYMNAPWVCNLNRKFSSKTNGTGIQNCQNSMPEELTLKNLPLKRSKLCIHPYLKTSTSSLPISKFELTLLLKGPKRILEIITRKKKLFRRKKMRRFRRYPIHYLLADYVTTMNEFAYRIKLGLRHLSKREYAKEVWLATITEHFVLAKNYDFVEALLKTTGLLNGDIVFFPSSLQLTCNFSDDALLYC